MTLEDLGYNSSLEKSRIQQNLETLDIGRIISEHKERYVVKTANYEFEAEITGNLRFTASIRSDFPAVGDWVAVSVFDNNLAIIHKILPRKNLLERQSVGKFGEKQPIAANIDFAFIMQSADRDFNINRLERYLTICYSARVVPIIVLSKTDLISETESGILLKKLGSRIGNIRVFAISNQTKAGYDRLLKVLKKGKTYCILGSSGVGKSTLINNLAGKDVMRTRSISISTKKGRHTTSHRELIVLEGGGIFIDNPGMREVGIADTADGLETAFDTIFNLSGDCKFKDCTHTHEKGCAVLAAVEKGILDKATYNNYLKIEKENLRFKTSIFEKRKKDRAFGKICKEGVKKRKQDKY
ncbi:MAG: ribosome small subunit-dependent GTPase A [Bacteroidales bacterium]|nr:MAG: ribosome small subunit-dependent GTPase A [Bacteroidales bacterium]